MVRSTFAAAFSCCVQVAAMAASSSSVYGGGAFASTAFTMRWVTRSA